MDTAALITLSAFTLGVVAIVVLTTRYRWHAFLAIFFVTLAVGLASGMAPETLIDGVIAGFGDTLGYIAIIVVSGMILGEFLEKTGAAHTLAQTVLKIVGKAKTGLAVSISGYLLAVPVMCSDTAFIVLSPIVKGLAAGANLSLTFLSLSLAVGTYTSFKLIPPSPGPLAILTMFEADFAKTLGLAFLVSLPVFAAGYLWARRSAAGLRSDLDPAPGIEATAERELPGALAAFLPIVFPMALIISKAIFDSALAQGHPIRTVFDFAGHPAIALPLGIGLLMFTNRRAGMERVTGWVSDGVTRSAPILLVVGAGGALGSILQQSGVGDDLGSLLTEAGIPGLLVPFLLAATLKITQGSSLVTMFTTPAIVAPALPSLGISPEIASLATIAGALAVVHVNDSFFWVVTRFAGMDVSAGYRSLTALTLLQGLVALAAVWGLSLVF